MTNTTNSTFSAHYGFNLQIVKREPAYRSQQSKPANSTPRQWSEEGSLNSNSSGERLVFVAKLGKKFRKKEIA